MKNLKTLLLPAVMVLAGAGSAYASHANKQNTSSPVQGYTYHSGQATPCVERSKECDTEGITVCTVRVGLVDMDLYDYNGTTCPNKLFEKIQ